MPPDDGDVLRSLEDIRRAHLLVVLEACGWNRAQAAKVLRINRKTVYRMITRFGLDKLERDRK